MWRVASNAAGEQDDRDAVTMKEAVKLAFSDWRVYMFILLNHACLLSQSFTYFFPSIVKSLGYGSTETLLLTAPVWFATLLFTLLITYCSSILRQRGIFIAVCMLVAAIGNIVMITTHSTGARMFAMYLLPIGVQPSFMMSTSTSQPHISSVLTRQTVLAWITSSFARPLTKRAVVVAIAGAFGNAASIYGSYMYPDSEGPRYVPAGIGLTVVCCFTAALALTIRFVLARENRKMERQERQSGEDEGFRYIL